MAGVANQARKTKTSTRLFILLPSRQDALPLITTRSFNRLDTLCQTHHRIAIRPRPDHQRSENLPPALIVPLMPPQHLASRSQPRTAHLTKNPHDTSPPFNICPA